jgi:tetratricopeptide (TPR) repeat protein
VIACGCQQNEPLNSAAAGGRAAAFSRQLVLRTLCGLAVVLSAANAASQDFGAQLDRAAVEPFLFQRRVVPGRTFTTAQLQSWLEAVAKHRAGEADDCTRVVASLTPDELADVVAGFEWNAVPPPVGTARTDLIKRAVILHTDIALMAAGDSPQPDRANVLPRASLHFGAALELVAFLRQQAPRGRDDPFALDWWRAVAAVLGQLRDTVSSPYYMKRAVSLFPHDPEILLIAGVLSELLASPSAQDAQPGFEVVHLRRAEQFYRDALKSDPNAVEALVRLGHVLGQQQRHAQAVSELKKVADDAAPPRVRYFKYLFLGEALEEMNEGGAAREAYQRALELYPGAQSAHLALARFERRAGDRVSSVAALQRLMERPPNAQAREDPWREYFIAGPARRAAEMIDGLRGPFRRQP